MKKIIGVILVAILSCTAINTDNAVTKKGSHNESSSIQEETKRESKDSNNQIVDTGKDDKTGKENKEGQEVAKKEETNNVVKSEVSSTVKKNESSTSSLSKEKHNENKSNDTSKNNSYTPTSTTPQTPSTSTVNSKPVENKPTTPPNQVEEKKPINYKYQIGNCGKLFSSESEALSEAAKAFDDFSDPARYVSSYSVYSTYDKWSINYVYTYW